MHRVPSPESWDALLDDVERILADGHCDISRSLDGGELPVVDPNEIRFNGVKPFAFGLFIMRPRVETWACRTHNFPYDAAVSAVLIAARVRLGSDTIVIHGDEPNVHGLALYNRCCPHALDVDDMRSLYAEARPLFDVSVQPATRSMMVKQKRESRRQRRERLRAKRESDRAQPAQEREAAVALVHVAR